MTLTNKNNIPNYRYMYPARSPEQNWCDFLFSLQIKLLSSLKTEGKY
jgi:hypothetical protein